MTTGSWWMMNWVGFEVVGKVDPHRHSSMLTNSLPVQLVVGYPRPVRPVISCDWLSIQLRVVLRCDGICLLSVSTCPVR